MIGFAGLACILLAEALLQWKYVGTDDKAGNAACVLFIFLFIAFFQVRTSKHPIRTGAELLKVRGCPCYHMGC